MIYINDILYGTVLFVPVCLDLFTCIYNAFVLNTLFLLYIYVYKLYYEMWNTPKIKINVWF